MNFALREGAVARDGSDCDMALHFPSDPCTWLMPELTWEYSYIVLLGVVLVWLLLYTTVVLRKYARERREIMVAESGKKM